MDKFDFAAPILKCEGQPITGFGPVTEPKAHTTWLEVRIPEELEAECLKAIKQVLRDHGYAKGFFE